VDQHKEDRGLNRCLRAIDLPKSTYYCRQKRSNGLSEEDQKLMSCVREIIDERPEYGYRRILPELEERTGRRSTINGPDGSLASMSWPSASVEAEPLAGRG